MDILHTDDPLGRDLKRIEFSKRLLSHRVRTSMITQLTGITRNRQSTLRRRWNVPEGTRLRGQSPRSLDVFLKSDQARAEAAAMAALCRTYGVLADLRQRSGEDSRIPPWTFARGLKACEAYEAYRACRPNTAMELSDVFLLVDALAKGDRIQLGHTKDCGCAVLIANYELGPKPCIHAHRPTA